MCFAIGNALYPSKKALPLSKDVVFLQQRIHFNLFQNCVALKNRLMFQFPLLLQEDTESKDL